MGTTVLIVDDHAGFRAMARTLLESDGYSVVGEAGDVRSGLAAARAMAPAIALVDVYLPDGSGFELAGQLRRMSNPPSVVLISSRDGAGFTELASENGASGFLPKAELSRQAIEELVR